jgi:hypothetical protein
MAKRNNYIAELAREILEQPEVIERYKREAKLGILDRNIETLFFHYAYGKPVERIEVADTTHLKQMSDEELETRYRELQEEMKTLDSIH